MAGYEERALLRGIDIMDYRIYAEVSGTDSFGHRFSGRFSKELVVDEGLVVSIISDNYERGKPITRRPHRYFVAPISGQFDEPEHRRGVMVQYENVEVLEN